MTQQLVLTSAEQASPAPTSAAPTDGPAARPTRIGRLDEETKRVGREGLSKARAALQEASRRAAERDAARLSRRDDELARRAAAAQRAAARRTGAAPGRTGRGNERPAAA